MLQILSLGIKVQILKLTHSMPTKQHIKHMQQLWEHFCPFWAYLVVFTEREKSLY